MMRSMMLLAAGVLALAACDKPATPETSPEDPNAKNTTTTGATTTVATTPPAPPAIEDSDLSTPADFEEAAEKAISKTNYKTELAALEADIAKE